MKLIKRLVIFVHLVFLMSLTFIVAVNAIVVGTTAKQIVEIEELESDFDCIVILGAAVTNGKPSPMLTDRLLKGVEIYNESKAPKIIVSGDNGKDYYDEVNPMKDFLVENGIPSEDIFMDHAGFETYDSIYRAKNIFNAKKIVVVTQKYHLYRAVYISNKLGLEAYGVSADLRRYIGQGYRDFREVFARIKAFKNGIVKPDPKYLGDSIPLIGSGDVTNDK